MKYLIDSHAILWIAFSEEKLSKNVKKILLDLDSEIYISAVSIWEINLKFSLGKLNLKGRTPSELFNGLDTFFNCEYLDLTKMDASTFFQLDTFHHRDPFDRIMIWQVLQNDLTFITDDEQIHKYTDCGLKVLW